MGSRVVRGGTLEERELREGWATEKDYLAPGDGPQTVSLRVYRLRPGRAAGPLHLHTHSDSVYFVLAGRVEVRLDDADHVLGRGDLAYIAPGSAHSIRNVGRREATILELYAPAEADFVHVPTPSE